MPYILSWLPAALIVVLGACSHNDQPAEANEATPENARDVRLIIKLEDNRANPADPGLLRELGRILKCRLRPVQPIATGGHVYTCPTALGEAAFAERLKALAERADIDYAELDQKRHIMHP